MNLETLKQTDKKYAKVIGEYLLNRTEKDEILLEKLVNTNKTLMGCLNYIKGEARKQAEDGCAVMLDDDVYNLAVHYFLEDNINREPRSAKKEETVEEETLFGTENKKIVSSVGIRSGKCQKAKQEKVKRDFANQLSIFDL